MAWIKVTNINGRERLINTNDIDYIHDEEDKTEIEFNDRTSMSVQEKVSKINYLIYLAESGVYVH